MGHENAKDAGIDPVRGADAHYANATRFEGRGWESQQPTLSERRNRIADHEVIEHPYLDQ